MLKEAGFGGVFLHPRPGLLTEYLSPRWFEVIEALIRKCIELDLIPALYDENSYPSGAGGGHTCTRRPEVRARHVYPLVGSGPPPHRFLSLYAWQDGVPETRLSGGDSESGQWIAFCEGEAMVVDWHGQVAPPSLLDPLTSETFLQATHEAYRKYLSPEAQRTVAAMFTDEPHLIAAAHGVEGRGLPITPYVRTRFRAEHAYALEDRLAELFFDVGDWRAVRFDFYDFCHRLWKESWALPLEDWHQRQGWKLTGHYLEHDWPVPYATPGQMELLAHMDWPGTDQLLGFALEGHDFHDIQNYTPAGPGQEPHLLYNLRQTLSVANQFGKERVMNECWGAGSHASTPADWLRIGQFLVAQGVNLLVPHHAMTSIRGTRKQDHPQFFSGQSPWFSRLGPLNSHLGRLCYAMAQGKMENRVLVLDAQTTGYILAEKGLYLKDREGGLSTRDRQGRMADLRETVVSQVQGLLESQVDFDLGDEYLMDNHGEVEGNCLRIGDQCYKVVVWPDGLSNLREATAKLLEAFLGAGGMLVGVRPGSMLVNGRASRLLESWDERFPNGVKWTTRDRLAERVKEAVAPRLLVEGSAQGVSHMRRKLPAGESWLLVNSMPESRFVVLPAASCWAEVNLESGCLQMLRESGPLRLELRPLEARLLLGDLPATTSLLPLEVLSCAAKTLPVGGKPLMPFSVLATSPNVLVLDHCRLRMRSGDYGILEARQANGVVWEQHGLSSQGWAQTVQYRRQVLDRAETLRFSGGYTATYEFEINEGVDSGGISLVVETPEYFEVRLNGTHLESSCASPWIDPNFARIPVGPWLNPGVNTVELRQMTFDPRAEVTPVYVVGDFGLEATERGFRIEPPVPLEMGSWKEMGRPFFDRDVAYDFQVESAGTVVVDSHSWEGSWLTAEMEGGRLQFYPGRPACIPVSGPGLLRLTVTGLPFNLFGPWHFRGDGIRKFCSPGYWPVHGRLAGPCPGEAYALIDLGLRKPPRFCP